MMFAIATSMLTRLPHIPECKGLPSYAQVPLPNTLSAPSLSPSLSDPSIVNADTETLRKVINQTINRVWRGRDEHAHDIAMEWECKIDIRTERK
jgi:hypothetical protein